MSDQPKAARLAPEPDEITRPFWDAAAEKRLVIQRCSGCGRHVFYPRAVCPDCMSTDLEWVEAAGTGEVYSFTVANKPAHPGMAAIVPYVVAVVALDEGPRMMTNIVGIDPASVSVGMRVKVSFEAQASGPPLPLFEPA